MTEEDNRPWGICDRTGFKVRHDTLRREWTGLMVRPESYDKRHPQDFVRGVPDKQSFPNPRPRPADVFVSPGDITADDL
jgi:hypothetical protein